MILVTYALVATLTQSTPSAAVTRPQAPQRVVYVRVTASINPDGVLGPGDVITGGRVMATRPSALGSTPNPVLDPGDLGGVGLTLPARGAPPPSSTDFQIALGPGDLVMGGTRPVMRR
jgi:hypothetical protein